MAYIDVRIHFTAEKDDLDPGYTYYKPSQVTRLDTTVPQEDILSIQEGLTQSDFGSIEFPNAIIDALSGQETTFEK